MGRRGRGSGAGHAHSGRQASAPQLGPQQASAPQLNGSADADAVDPLVELINLIAAHAPQLVPLDGTEYFERLPTYIKLPWRHSEVECLRILNPGLAAVILPSGQIQRQGPQPADWEFLRDEVDCVDKTIAQGAILWMRWQWRKLRTRWPSLLTGNLQLQQNFKTVQMDKLNNTSVDPRPAPAVWQMKLYVIKNPHVLLLFPLKRGVCDSEFRGFLDEFKISLPPYEF